MNWLAIKTQAELYRRDTVNYPKRWFNEGKSLLANMYQSACKQLTQNYTVPDTDEVFTLPAGCKYVKAVVNTEFPRYGYKDYDADISAGTIAFNMNGTFTVVYLTETVDVVGTDSEVPEINAAYHYVLAKYIAGKELEYIRPEWYQQMMTQFFQESDIANKSLNKGSMGVFKTPKRRFR